MPHYCRQKEPKNKDDLCRNRFCAADKFPGGVGPVYLKTSSAGSRDLDQATIRGGLSPFRIYSNNRILDYYAGQDVFLSAWHYLGAISSPETLKDRMDLIAIRAGRSDIDGYYQHVLSLIGETPAMTFEDHKGDRVEIFDFRKKQP